MNLTFILWLSASMAIFLSAATASRYYVSSNNILILIVSLGLYCVGNLMMVRLMREGGLALAISASAIVQLILINVIAFAVFGERMTLPQLAGVALGIVSMGLMMLPAGGKA
jgi:glucose uptake protein